MSRPFHHISICVCTFRRPALLLRLLRELQAHRDDKSYACRIIIADNDDARSAWPIVEQMRRTTGIPIEYIHVPERSIARARNAAVAKATGDLIAFIDDDEFPAKDWLGSLVRCYDLFQVNGVLGPVMPHYEEPPPRWVVRSGICERPAPPTGTDVGQRDMRTGNALLSRELFVMDEAPFDLKFGTIGGSDVIFFERMVSRGKTFMWCNEAVVFESVTKERLKVSYYLRRALARGLGNAQRARPFSWATLKSLVAFMIYTPILPISIIFGKHVFMRLLISDCDHIGRILGLVGMTPVKGRPYESVDKASP